MDKLFILVIIASKSCFGLKDLNYLQTKQDNVLVKDLS